MKSRPEGLDHQRIHLCHRHRGSRRNEVEARRPRSRAVNFGGDGLVDAAMKSRPEGLDHLELLGVSALAPVAAMKSRPEGLDHRPAGPGSSRRADSRNEVEARRPRSRGGSRPTPSNPRGAAMKSRPEGLDHPVHPHPRTVRPTRRNDVEARRPRSPQVLRAGRESKVCRNEVEARRPRSPGTYHAIPGLK